MGWDMRYSGGVLNDVGRWVGEHPIQKKFSNLTELFSILFRTFFQDPLIANQRNVGMMQKTLSISTALSLDLN